jgi:hypothetical protein
MKCNLHIPLNAVITFEVTLISVINEQRGLFRKIFSTEQNKSVANLGNILSVYSIK